MGPLIRFVLRHMHLQNEIKMYDNQTSQKHSASRNY